MKRQLIYISMFMLVGTLSHASELMTAKQAVLTAVQRNHAALAALHEKGASNVDVNLSMGKYLPKIFLSEEAASSNSPTQVFMMKLDQGRFGAGDFEIGNLNNPKAYQDFKTQLSLQQPLFDKSLPIATAVARVGSEISAHALEATREDVGLTAFAAWLNIRKAHASKAVADKAVLAAKESLRLATVRSDLGTGLKSDLLRARTYASETEQQAITAENDLVLAKLNLGLLIGRPGEEIEIEETALPILSSPVIADLKQLARANRADVKQAVGASELASLDVAKAKVGYYPTVTANINYQMNDRNTPFSRDNDSWGAGVVMKWELFSGRSTPNEVVKTGLHKMAVDETLAAYLEKVDYQVTEYLMRYQEATKRLESSMNSAVDAEETVRLIRRRYENSLSTMSELLDAETVLTKARAAVADMENSKALALAHLYHAAGVFLKEVAK